MNCALYWTARGLLALLQRLPLSTVARLGRLGGGIAYSLDARHRRVALRNLAAALGSERPESELRALARENFRRIGENFAAAVKTAAMTPQEIRRILKVDGLERLAARGGEPPPSRVFAVGHFGNFELYAKANLFLPGAQFATTYRALRQPGLNRVLQELRGRSGCLFFERRTEAGLLKQAMQRPGLLLGFLADQHAGDRGTRAKFFGRECSASAAPALFAQRYDRPLHVAICYREALGEWRIEIGPEIATAVDGQRRSAAAITQDIQAEFERAIRCDPANWFWVHNRWKPVKPPRRT